MPPPPISFWSFQFDCQDRLAWEDPYLQDFSIPVGEWRKKCLSNSWNHADILDRRDHIQAEKKTNDNLYYQQVDLIGIGGEVEDGAILGHFGSKNIWLEVFLKHCLSCGPTVGFDKNVKERNLWLGQRKFFESRNEVCISSAPCPPAKVEESCYFARGNSSKIVHCTEEGSFHRPHKEKNFSLLPSKFSYTKVKQKQKYDPLLY